MKIKLLRYLLLTFFSAVISVPGFSQYWLWVDSITGPSKIVSRGIAVDNQDNIYFQALFKSEANIGGTTVNSFAPNSQDILFGKYNNNGVLQWVGHAGSDQNDAPKALTVDALGNIYITGKFRDTCVFYDVPTGLPRDSVISFDASSDVYLAKYSTDGVFQWAKSIATGTGNESSEEIAVDDNGNIFVIGNFNLSASIGDSTFTDGTGGIDNYVVKIDNNGDFIWAYQGKNDDDESRILGLGIAPDGGCYITGHFLGSMIIGSYTLNSVGGTRNIVNFKLREDGSVEWAKREGGSDEVRSVALAADPAGGFYITGYFINSIIFKGVEYLGQGSDDIFLAKYNDIGGGEWISINSSKLGDRGYDVAVKDTIVFLAGYYSDSVFFAKDTLSSPSNYIDIFVAKYSTSGLVIGADKAIGNGDDRSLQVAAGSDETAYVTGFYRSDPIDFGDWKLGNYGGQDMFIAKYGCNSFTINSITIQDILCYSVDEGIIDIQASGGTAPYIYSIDEGENYSSNNIFNNLPGDSTYVVRVKDLKGCYSRDSLVYISTPDSISLTESVTDLLCHDDSNGTITLSASGGVGNYEYSISGGTDFYNNGGIFTDLSEGTYPVAVKDGNDCVKNGSTLVVNNPAQLTFTQEKTIDITCNGLTDGRIELLTTGGTGEISYSINGGTNYFTNGGIFTDLPVGSNYQTAAMDANDCEITGLILEITEPEPLSALITKTDISCNDYNDAEIIVNASGGVGDYSYSKDNGTDFQKEYIFSGLPGGSYPIVVKDSNDCSQSYGPIIINNPEVIAYVDESTGDISCYAETDGNITVEATGGSEFLIYTLSQGLNIIEENVSGIFNNLDPGAYTVKVNDANHCGDDIPSRGFNIAEPDSLIIDSIATEKETPNEMNGTLTVYASGGTPFYSYLLQPVNVIQTDPAFPGLAAGDYEVIVTDLNNCSATGYAAVGSAAIEIFDAFSPNGDGYNDVWNIGSVSYYPQCNIRVFNTWGTLVFSSTGYLEPWDGTKNGALLPSGTYYYIIELGNGEDPYTGTVNILK